MTSTSQSEISTPLSLMLTPMKSLLPAVSPLELAAARAGAAAAASVGAGAAAGGRSRVAAAACACWRSGAPADAARAGAIGGSYSAGLSPDLPASAGVSRRLKLSMNSPSESVFHFMTLSFLTIIPFCARECNPDRAALAANGASALSATAWSRAMTLSRIINLKSGTCSACPTSGRLARGPLAPAIAGVVSRPTTRAPLPATITAHQRRNRYAVYDDRGDDGDQRQADDRRRDPIGQTAVHRIQQIVDRADAAYAEPRDQRQLRAR